jgi:hypothetical protein
MVHELAMSWCITCQAVSGPQNNSLFHFAADSRTQVSSVPSAVAMWTATNPSLGKAEKQSFQFFGADNGHALGVVQSELTCCYVLLECSTDTGKQLHSLQEANHAARAAASSREPAQTKREVILGSFLSVYRHVWTVFPSDGLPSASLQGLVNGTSG